MKKELTVDNNDTFNLKDRIEKERLAELPNVKKRHESALSKIERSSQIKKDNLEPMRRVIQELRREYANDKSIVINERRSALVPSTSIEMGQFHSITLYYLAKEGTFSMKLSSHFKERFSDDPSLLTLEQAIDLIVKCLGKYLASRDFNQT